MAIIVLYLLIATNAATGWKVAFFAGYLLYVLRNVNTLSRIKKLESNW